jgi:hypothetical protein
VTNKQKTRPGVTEEGARDACRGGILHAWQSSDVLALFAA